MQLIQQSNRKEDFNHKGVINLKFLITLLAILVILSSIANAKLYIWVDKDGVKHVSNIPPKEEIVMKEKKEEGFAPPIKLKESLILSDWFPLKVKSGYTITGTVKNNSSYTFKQVIVRATAKDNDGNLLLQREVRTDPFNILPKGTGKFKIVNVKTDISFLTKKNLRFDIFNKGKIETTLPGKKELNESLKKIEVTD